jgi:molybdopterin molybdotransferase
MSAAEPFTPDRLLALIGSLCGALEPESVPLAAANGRVLREPVLAPEDQPAFDRSSVDGYAVRMDDHSPRFRLVDEIRAGNWRPRELRVGEAARIATGGALPAEGLQVVMREDALVEGNFVQFTERDAERNIRFRGEEARAGQTLVETGSLLRPGTLSLLASAGCAAPFVTRLPRVRHVATGNEIIPPEQSPARGQIRDSNSTLVRAFLWQRAIIPEQSRAPEDEMEIQRAVGESGPGTSRPDLLLISGGASVGEHDFTQRVLERAGFAILVNQTTARPGKPMILARRGPALAFGLPGNPLAHFACLNLYVRAVLEAWAGQTHKSAFHEGILADDLDAGGHSREALWPSVWRWTPAGVALTPLRWTSSGDMTALVAANALVRVAAAAGKLARGARVQFIHTDLIE